MGSESSSSREDLLVARRGGAAEWCGVRLRRLPPWAACVVAVIVGWAILVGVMIAMGVLLIEVLVPGAVGDWDGDVVRALVGERTAPLTDASAVGSGLADTMTVVAIGLVLVAVLLAKRAWRLLALVVVGLVVEITAYLAITEVLHRQRPIVEQLERLRQGASYPSGHTAAAFALYFSIAAVATVYASRSLTRIAWVAVAIVPVIVAVSRIYRGMHHPTDAIAGLLMGIGCVTVALLAVRTAGVVAEHRARVQRPKTLSSRTRVPLHERSFESAS